MRLTAPALHAGLIGLGVLAASLSITATPAAAKPMSAQAKSCTANANRESMTGAKRRTFLKTCMQGPLTAKTPTEPTDNSKEAQAVTKPSGVDRTTRSKQCATEADRKGLSSRDRRAYQLSCLATAGPVSEGETQAIAPHPAHAIKGIGVNNYKPSDTTAKSVPAKPQP